MALDNIVGIAAGMRAGAFGPIADNSQHGSEFQVYTNTRKI
jgi:hypothetical protein